MRMKKTYNENFQELLLPLNTECGNYCQADISRGFTRGNT